MTRRALIRYLVVTLLGTWSWIAPSPVLAPATLAAQETAPKKARTQLAPDLPTESEPDTELGPS